MTVWVYRDGVLVNKASLRSEPRKKSEFATPMLSKLEPYRSPIDGKEITSWAARDKDLKDNNAYDPRDTPRRNDNGRRTAEQLTLPLDDA